MTKSSQEGWCVTKIMEIYEYFNEIFIIFVSAMQKTPLIEPKGNGGDKPGGRVGRLLGNVVKFAVPLLVSVGLCYVLFHEMDFGEMVAFVRRDCDFMWIAVSALLGVFCMVVRGLRWRIQLRASGVRVPVLTVCESIAGTYAVNIVFPRLGELWRSEFVARRQNAPFATVFGSMLAERATDTICVGLMTVVAFITSHSVLTNFVETKVDHSGLIYRTVSSPWTYVAGLLLLAVAIWLIFRACRKHPDNSVARFFGNMAGGIMSIFRMKGGGMWLLLTLFLWAGYYFEMLACFEAFGLTRDIVAAHGQTVVFVCYVLGSLSMAVPSNGGIGPYQIAVVFGLECFAANLDPARGYAFANVVLGTQTLLIILLGLATFIHIGIYNARTKNVKTQSFPPR